MDIVAVGGFLVVQGGLIALRTFAWIGSQHYIEARISEEDPIEGWLAERGARGSGEVQNVCMRSRKCELHGAA